MDGPPNGSRKRPFDDDSCTGSQLDGSGVSAFDLDITKTQLFFTDFEWLGVGRVRCGFSLDGKNIVAHEFYNSNNVDTVYMSNPNLPVRCEIRNTGAQVGAGGSFIQICSTVMSEGGYTEAGREFSHATSLRSVGVGSTVPILSIKLKNSFKDYPNSTVEYFYWDPSCAKMLAKQAHTIKKWLEIFPYQQKLWNVKTTSYRSVLLEHERILRNLLYTTCNADWFQVDKPEFGWFCEFDHWFINGFKNTRANIIWREGVDYATSLLSNHIRKDSQGNADGLKPFVKSYYVGDINFLV